MQHLAISVQAAAGVSQPLVLVVEDDVLVRLAVSEHLRAAGHAVLEAGSSDEALSVLESGLPVDIIFSDVQVPGPVDGIGVVAMAHYHRPEARVILTSADPYAGRRAEALDDIAFIAKPYRPEEVEERILLELQQGGERAIPTSSRFSSGASQ